MKALKKSAFAFALALVATACSPSLLKDWVRERKGYRYYSDYSSMPILGDIQKGDSLERNPYFIAVPDESKLPERAFKENFSVFLRGSLNIQKFLEKITGGNIKGDFSSGHKVFMTLKQPFKEEARAFIPIGSCLDVNMRVVTKALNAGDMEIIIENDREENITASFNRALEAEGSQGVKFGERIETKGKKFYVGYYAETFHCRRTAEKTLVLPRGTSVNEPKLGLVSIKYQDSRKIGFDRHALVYISPGASEFIEAGREGPPEEALSEDQVWERSAKPRDGMVRMERDGHVQVKEGTKIGVAGIVKTSGIYIEVISVKENAATVRVQHMRYDFKRPAGLR